MDRGWLTIPRHLEAYTDGVNLFLDQATANGVGPDKFRCPCKKCSNRYTFGRSTIMEHLVWNDMDKDYKKAWWRHHGEPNIGEPATREDEDDVGGGMDGMHDFINEVFVQSLTEDGVGSSTEPPIMEGRPIEAETFFKLLEEADKELYPGCKEFKKLEAVVRLYQIKCLGGLPDHLFTMLLELVKKMLPDGDCLPDSCYKAKKLINGLGLTYEKIDACPNDCMIYWKDTSKLTACSVCGKSRYKEDEDDTFRKKVSAKVMWYFPLKSRLKRFFMSKHIAEHMRWHATECPKDGFMRHPSDSPAWKHLDNLYPEFASEIRNVRLGLASDGFNPFGQMSISHSTWPVVLSVYNLPPWMCMKQPNLLLSLLIPGPKSPGNDIDVYLRPLIDELNELWEVGTLTYDVFSDQTFTMKAAVLWTISDFPAYGMLSGWSTKGYKACPHCMDDNVSQHLPVSRKICYLGHRRFLPIRHRFRREKAAFNGLRENRQAPRQLSGVQCLEQLSSLRFTFGKQYINILVGQRRRRTSNPRSNNGQWRKKSIFFELPYWRHLLIRHNLDVMHIEKNVCDNLVGTLLDIARRTKDGLAARADLEVMNIRHSQHPRREGDRTFLPPALFTLTKEEKTLFCKILSTIRVPDGYSSNLSRCVNVHERRIIGLKSHDCHVLMQQLLPLAIRGVLPKSVTMVLLELSAIFRQLCSKKETESAFTELGSRVALTLCQMEKIFPPSFFDVMVHLPIHLADEAATAGPVQYRWMYPIERYLQTLKRYVRNKSRPEGSIAEGYLVDEGLSFCSMYLRDVETRRNRKGRNADGTGRGVSGGLSIFDSTGCYLGSGENMELDLNDRDRCHRYILDNCDEVIPFRRQHEEFLKNKHRRERLTRRQIMELSKKEFPEWFQNHINARYASDPSISEDLHWLANPPRKLVRRYKSHTINGFRFRIKSVDDKHKNQNSGVFVSASIPGGDGQVNCYGVVIDMFEVRYYGPTEVEDRGRIVMLFKCDWVDSGSPRGMKTDQYGFTLVNLNRLGFKEDPFILASQAIQVFYVADPVETDWHVVVRTHPRDLFDVLEDKDTIDDYAIPNLDDRVLDNDDLQTRAGVEETSFDQALPLPTELVNSVVDDELNDDDMVD